MNPLQNLPKVDKFVTTPLFAGLNLRLLTKIAQEEIEKLRNALLSGEETSVDEAKLALHVKHRYDAIFQPSLKPSLMPQVLFCTPIWAEALSPQNC